METIEEKPDAAALEKYRIIVSVIDGVENRMKWSELAYLFLNLVVFFTTIYFISSVMRTVPYEIEPIYMLIIFFCHAIGISLNAFWTASSMRLQLKLKLRYFQARYLERKLYQPGESLFLDESLFFNPKVREVKSPDGEETVVYPTEGILRMDGFIGAAKPRVLSLMMPLFFFMVYLFSLISIYFMFFL